ncbi:PREDICTED: uncharacterized protein LOC108550343, partial [Eufriesea mexicana]|uniref:uncharacterized protein LOC108550343 n=1 Tax=Eufriesea mexicana TaxID=516756 RepID=UPI00083BAA46
MNLLMIRFCKQLRYSVYNNINDITKRYNCVSNIEKSNNTSSTIKSIKFQGYKVIYLFPYIVHARIFNKLKCSYTILISATIPVSISLKILDFISSEQNLNFVCAGLILTSSLHVSAYICNNVVGSICYKDDDKYLEDQEIIISYINYWGKRIDFKTTVNNITPFSENPTTYNYLYESLNAKSCNKNLKLKMYIKYGQII